MNKLTGMGMAFCLGLTMLVSCERSQRVQAGSEGITGVDFQPRTAPEPGVALNRDPADGPIKGQVMSVDVAGQGMLIRVENGMEQTVKWNNGTTTVQGVPSDSKSATTTPTTAASMKALAARPGSEVVIAWIDDNGQKMATVIKVTDLSSPTKQPKKKIRRIKST